MAMINLRRLCDSAQFKLTYNVTTVTYQTIGIFLKYVAMKHLPAVWLGQELTFEVIFLDDYYW